MTSSTEQPLTLDLTITGMDCADCALNLERGIANLDGVEACEVRFTTGKMQITGTPDQTALEGRIKALGYGVAAPDAEASTATPDYSGAGGLLRFLADRSDTRLALVGTIVLLFSFLLSLMTDWPLVVTVLQLLVIGVVGLPTLVSGWRELFYTRRITINLLMSIAAVGAVIIGEIGEAATVIVLFTIGEALEGYAAEKARYSLRSLLNMVPQEAVVVRPCMDCAEHIGQDGYEGGPCPFCEAHESLVPVSDLQIGDTILIPPGEQIPMDGLLRSGTSAVNQAPITGESIPVDKVPGDQVFAGSINGTGALEVQVTHLAADNTLSRIIHLVEEAQSQRAPSQRYVDNFAQWYTPAVVVLAALVAFLPPLLTAIPFWNTPDGFGSLYRACALLLIACPCALVISTPVTIVSALTSAARQGILIKGGAPLETLATAKAIAFDKTGTLTIGQPRLMAAQAVNCTTGGADMACEPCQDLLALAAALERRSEHPIAQAVVTAAEERHVLNRYPAAQHVTSLTGQGVQGTINDHAVTIGSHAYFDTQYPHSPMLCQTAQALEQQGQTTMLLAEDEEVLGVLAVADQPRDSSSVMMAALENLQPPIQTIMLTGDNPAAAQAVADQIGVADVRAGLLPADKLTAIQELTTTYGPTAMIGDGINDAPALAAAAVGIAMGGSGTTQAMETADIVLMQDDLSRLPDAINLSRRTRRIIRQNIMISLGLKALFLGLALTGAATLWMAVFADVGTSLLVTFNGMRMLRE